MKKFFFTLLLILSPLIGWFLYIELSSPSAIAIIEGADGPTYIYIGNNFTIDLIVVLIYYFTIIFFWANLAEKMGKEYGVYILFGLISIYLSPLLLAFESIDKFFTSHSIFRLSQEEKKLSYISSE